MTTLKDARRAWEKVQSKFTKETPVRYGFLGDGRGQATSNLYVTGGSGELLWARERIGTERFFPVLNKSAVVPQFNLPVTIGYRRDNPRQEQILKTHVGGLGNIAVSGVGLLGPHHSQHEFGGGDVVFVDGLQFKPGLVKPTGGTAGASMQLQVLSFVYFWNSWQQFTTTTTDSFAQYKPASGKKVYVMIAVDPRTNSLVYRPGLPFTTTAFTGTDFDISKVPAPSGDELPLSFILLESTTTVLDWGTINNNSIGDARLHVPPPMLHILSRIEQLEGYSGNEPNIATTGAGTESVADNFHRLQDLTDLAVSSVSDGQGIIYDVATNRWIPGSVGGSGAVATDTIWDAKGDLAGGTGSNTAARLPVGTNRYHLVADSTQTTGLKWAFGSGWFNVKEYGATGDGATDDTASITSAISAMNTAGGGVLYFPDGVYITTGGFTLTENCNVIGDGDYWVASQVKCSSATAVLFQVNAQMVNFRDLYFINTHATPTAGNAINGLGSVNGQHINLMRVTVDGFYDDVVYLSGSNWVIDNCWIGNARRYGLYVSNAFNGDQGDWGIVNSIFTCAANSPTSAIRIASSGGGRIVNCKINSSTTGWANGIDLAVDTSTTILLIANNSIENVRTNGIKLTNVGAATWGQIIIDGNQFGMYNNTTNAAIVATANSVGDLKDLVISNNTFLSQTSPAVAINLTNIDKVRITNNIIDGYLALLTQSGCTNISSFQLDTSMRINPVGAADTDYLKYNSTSGSWIASAASTMSGGTLGTFTPSPVGASATAGSSASGTRGDHVHKGAFSVLAGAGASVSSDVSGNFTVGLTGSGWTSAIQLASRSTGVTYTNGSLTRYIAAVYAASTTLLAQGQLQFKTGATSPPGVIIADVLSAGVAESQRKIVGGLVLPNEYYTIIDLSQVGASIDLMKWTEYDNYGGAPAGAGNVADYFQLTYSNAAIDCGLSSTNAGFVDVHTTNAAMTFTPASAGKYEVIFRWSHYMKASATAGELDAYFRLTDSTTNTMGVELYVKTGDMETEATLSHVFDWAAVAKTVLLQKRVITATSVNANNIGGVASTIGLYMTAKRIGN